MTTVVGVWEPGFTDEQLFVEWRMWKQTIGAYCIRDWRMVGNVPGCGAYQEFERIEDAIADTDEARRIFLIPDAELVIFGNVSESLRRLVTPASQAARIVTPFSADMFAAACLPLVLHHVN
jgi:hypothetical protein